MFPLPESDYTRPQVLASWLELSALSEDNGAAFRGDVLGMMKDSQLFLDHQDDDSSNPHSAAGKVAETWRVLRSRQRILGNAWPFDISDDALSRSTGRQTLDDVAAYAAMLLIEAASSRWYAALAIEPGDKIRSWFEEIAVVAIRQLFNGRTTRFGAPFPDGWPQRFAERVKHLAGLFELDSRDSEVAKLASQSQQDDSLDIVARHRVTDEDGGVPYILVQCATGANWPSDKPGQPTISLWDRYIAWDGPRIKALAIPFALREAGELENASVRHFNALVFDRIRLAGTNPDVAIDDELRNSLVAWCRKKFSLMKKGEQNFDFAPVAGESGH